MATSWYPLESMWCCCASAAASAGGAREHRRPIVKIEISKSKAHHDARLGPIVPRIDRDRSRTGSLERPRVLWMHMAPDRLNPGRIARVPVNRSARSWAQRRCNRTRTKADRRKQKRADKALGRALGRLGGVQGASGRHFSVHRTGPWGTPCVNLLPLLELRTNDMTAIIRLAFV